MKKVFFVLLVTIFILSGCGGKNSHVTSTQKGSIVLTISESGVKAQTIEPEIDMNIAAYDIFGTGPKGANFHQNNVTAGAPVTLNTLAVGAWTIEVDAKNKDGMLIAIGVTANIPVTAGVTANASVTVKPINGTGTLDVTVSWPTGIITNPTVIGTLTLAGGTTQNISYPLAGNSLSANYRNPSLTTGYYTLITQLKEGDTVKWGGIDAVRIINGQTSTGVYKLKAAQGEIGDVELTVTPDLQNPITIAFRGQQDHLTIGTDMTITATPTEDVDSYQWYLNGTTLPGKTGASIRIGSALGVGDYRLDLVVTKGSIVCSGTVNFDIGIPNPPEKTLFVEMQPWYGNPLEGPSTSWYHWDFNNHYPADNGFLINRGKRDVASIYYPIIGAYDSYDTKVIDWQIDICKAMLIDCIMIDYYGDGITPYSPEFQHYKEVTHKIITQAARKGIKVTILYETQVQNNSTDKVNDILSDLNSIINNSAWMNSTAYLHYNNIPVICIFGIYKLRDYEWDTIKQSIDNKACLVADTQPYQYEFPYRDNTAFNGCFKWDLYHDSISSGANPNSDKVRNWANRINNDCGWWVTQGVNRFAFSMIWPGFNDSAVLWGPNRIPRVVNFFTSDHPADHTAFYAATMEAALNPVFSNQWVLIATLNDWNESTSIEPSKEKGYELAIKTKQFAETFKGISADQKQPDSIIQTITESYEFTYH